MNNNRETSALNAMLRTPSITDMHEYMYLQGVEWADNHPSDETINKIITLRVMYMSACEEDEYKGDLHDFIQTHWGLI